MSTQTSSLKADDDYVPVFDENDTEFIEDYARNHVGDIKGLVNAGILDAFMFRTILTDFLVGILVNANAEPQDS